MLFELLMSIATAGILILHLSYKTGIYNNGQHVVYLFYNKAFMKLIEF